MNSGRLIFPALTSHSMSGTAEEISAKKSNVVKLVSQVNADIKSCIHTVRNYIIYTSLLYDTLLNMNSPNKQFHNITMDIV